MTNPTTFLVIITAVAVSGATVGKNETEYELLQNPILGERNETGIDLFSSLLGSSVEPDVDGIPGLSICPSGWSRYGSRCFKFVQSLKTWIEAEKYCVHFGGNLASVHSSEENYFLQDLILSQMHDFVHAWIGGFDAVQDATWLWSDGSRFDYRNWLYGQPNNGGGREHCMEMNTGGEKRWNDHICSELKYFVCSKRKC